MPNVVQVEIHPEYLKWPSRCVCCGRPDERDMETAVSSTDPDERADSVIFTVELPYCIECYDHCNAPSSLWRTVAVVLILGMIDTSVLGLHDSIRGAIILISAVIFGVYMYLDFRKSRSLMRPSCSAKSGHIYFGNPTNTRISTITFTNSIVAESFKERNRYNLIER